MPAGSTSLDPFDNIFAAYCAEIESSFNRYLPDPKERPQRLHEAMRYSMEAGGKRLRPTLTLAVADLYAARKQALPAALAVECIHTFSLIHDDLPCMDNDDLRRGKPTAHRQFDEPTALLAGDALLAFAFSLIAREYQSTPLLAIRLLQELSTACGSNGLVGGQMEDILAEKIPPTTEQLDYIHRHKTAALIEKAMTLGALIGQAREEDLQIIREVGQGIGLAFQIIDDILDETADAQTLGKTPGKDAAVGKATFVALFGLDEARTQANNLSNTAAAKLKSLPGDTAFLVSLVRKMQNRIS
ncbi:MAG: polyprenyl synthetase family protein [Opitutales bacterium]|nr:polyprenyl synthetase family protein [Opitutales bacterium]MCH8540565.1 polyprenyl synthetase family protein [Opitutales bacterium]